MATSAEGTKVAVGKSPGGVCDGRQHSLQGIFCHTLLEKSAFLALCWCLKDRGLESEFESFVSCDFIFFLNFKGIICRCYSLQRLAIFLRFLIVG